MESATQVQILEKAVCISFCTNAFEKGMNPSFLPAVMGKIEKQTGFFNLGKVISLEKRKP